MPRTFRRCLRKGTGHRGRRFDPGALAGALRPVPRPPAAAGGRRPAARSRTREPFDIVTLKATFSRSTSQFQGAGLGTLCAPASTAARPRGYSAAARGAAGAAANVSLRRYSRCSSSTLSSAWNATQPTDRYQNPVQLEPLRERHQIRRDDEHAGAQERAGQRRQRVAQRLEHARADEHDPRRHEVPGDDAQVLGAEGDHARVAC